MHQQLRVASALHTVPQRKFLDILSKRGYKTGMRGDKEYTEMKTIGCQLPFMEFLITFKLVVSTNR